MSVEFKNELLQEDPVLAAEWEKNSSRRKLSQALILVRKHAGLTQAELAERIGWKQSAVSRIESATGPMPDTTTIDRYVRGCGMHMTIRIEDDPYPARADDSLDMAEAAQFGVACAFG